MRLLLAEDGSLKQSTDYYPFGLTMRQTMVPSPDNRYGYNGKELQQETQWLDYAARMYDGGLGRFFTQDRFSEKYLDFSPYQYAAGNPVKYIDVNGDYIMIYDGDQRYKYENGILYSRNEDKKWEKAQVEEDSFAYNTVEALNELRDGVVGESLVTFFEGEKYQLSLRENDKNENSNSGVTVYLNPRGEGGIVPTQSGLEKGPLFVSMAHEMAHAQDRYTRSKEIIEKEWVSNPGRGEIMEGEKYASHIENLIRTENNLPLRTHYSYSTNGMPDERTRLIKAGTRVSVHFKTYKFINNTQKLSDVKEPLVY